MVRAVGIEPTFLSEPDFEPGATPPYSTVNIELFSNPPEHV